MIDTHTHITDPKFDLDREEVLKRAADAGISAIFETVCEQDLWDKGLEISKRDDVFVYFGIHPHNAGKVAYCDFDRLDELIQNPKCIGLGEAGLDYHYDFSPRDVQKDIFETQVEIALAQEFLTGKAKPLILHCREAFDDLLKILTAHSKSYKGIIHSFDGTLEQAKTFIDLGFMIGICSTITFPKSDSIKEIVVQIDISKIMPETDCPYRAPQKFRGQRSEPSYLVEIVKEIAKIKNIPFLQAQSALTQNALNFIS
jgi:TatD DNase family protein